MTFRRSEDLIEVARRFQSVASSHTKTHHGKRALLDQARLYQNFRTLRASNAEKLSFPHPEFDDDDKNALIDTFRELGRLLNRQL